MIIIVIGKSSDFPKSKGVLKNENEKDYVWNSHGNNDILR